MSAFNAFVSHCKNWLDSILKYGIKNLYWQSKTPHQRRIEKFMRGAGQFIPAVPIIPDDTAIMLRARLITEEYLETMEAMGITLRLSYDDNNLRFTSLDDLELTKERPLNIVDTVDGIADLSVVSIGTLSTLGIADNRILAEVDHNNISKLKGGYKSSMGKFIKPPNHQPPDIKKILTEQGYTEQ